MKKSKGKGSVFTVVFDAGGSGGSLAKESDEIEAILRDTEVSVTSRVARIAAVYRRAGVGLSEAFRLAWADVKKFAEEAGEAVSKTEGYLSGLDEIRRYSGSRTTAAPATSTSTASKPSSSSSSSASIPDAGEAEASADAVKKLTAAAARLGAGLRDVELRVEGVRLEVAKVGAYLSPSLGGIAGKLDALADSFAAAVAAGDAASDSWRPLAVFMSGALAGAVLAASSSFASFGGLLGGGVLGGALGAAGALGALSALLSGQLLPGIGGAEDGFTLLSASMSGPLSAGAAGALGRLGALSGLLSGQLLSGAGNTTGGFTRLSSLLSGELSAGTSAAAGGLSSLGATLSGPVSGGCSTAAGRLSSLSTLMSGDVTSSAAGLLSYMRGDFRPGWEGVWSGLGELPSEMLEGVTARVKTWLNTVIGYVNRFSDGIGRAFGALGSFSFTVPDWVPGIGGQTLGLDIPAPSLPELPYLARGAVIPPRAPFAAVLGDQTRGTNVEAPLATIEEAVERVFARHGGDERTYRFTAQLGRRVLFDELIDEAKLRRSATGRDPFALS